MIGRAALLVGHTFPKWTAGTSKRLQWAMCQEPYPLEVDGVGTESSPLALPLPERYVFFFSYGAIHGGKLRFHFPTDRIENMHVVER